jgi:uncharacterized pyridoxamine 5'-phosphate oxidase family protein
MLVGERMEEEEFDDLINMITKQAVVYLATIDGDIPRVRPVTMVTFGSRHYILTGMNDAKIDQIMKNDLVESCYPISGDKGKGYIRMEGKIEIVSDMDTKRDVAGKTEYFKEYWSTPEDPTYALLEFHIQNIEYLKPGGVLAKKYRKEP